MDIVAWLAIGAIVAGLASWGVLKYRQMNADGSISLDEVIEAITDGVSELTAAKDDIEEVLDNAENKKA